MKSLGSLSVNAIRLQVPMAVILTTKSFEAERRPAASVCITIFASASLIAIMRRFRLTGKAPVLEQKSQMLVMTQCDFCRTLGEYEAREGGEDEVRRGRRTGIATSCGRLRLLGLHRIQPLVQLRQSHTSIRATQPISQQKLEKAATDICWNEADPEAKLTEERVCVGDVYSNHRHDACEWEL